jgi:hypothetical protein
VGPAGRAGLIATDRLPRGFWWCEVTTLRRATRDDERRLAALDRATWSPAVAPVPLWPDDVDFFAHDAPEDVLVAELDGAVVGFVKLRRPTALAPTGTSSRWAGWRSTRPCSAAA